MWTYNLRQIGEKITKEPIVSTAMALLAQAAANRDCLQGGILLFLSVKSSA